MSWDLNHVTLIGRLTRNPEVRYSTQGNAYATLGVAVNRRSGNKENPVNEVSYFNVVVFGKLAEICNDYLVKGKQVAISGYLRQRRWEKNGEKFSMVEIIAEQLQFLSPNTGTSESNYMKRDVNLSNPIKDNGSDKKKSKSSENNKEEETFDEEIPF